MLAISMSEYDWCLVFAASNREYLYSRLVLAAVPASMRSGVLFQTVFRRPCFFSFQAFATRRPFFFFRQIQFAALYENLPVHFLFRLLRGTSVPRSRSS